MMKVYILLIAICIAQCAFLQDYSEVETSCGVNVKCSMVPYVKSCEKYDYCLKDGWYYNVKCHKCQKITIKDGYYPTDNFFKTKSDCDCACSSEVSTISEYKNLDPTYECKKSPDFYSEGYSESKYYGQLWTYNWQYKKCVTFDYPVSDYQPSYNIFYNKQDCEDFCINYLYDHQHEGGDDYGHDDYGHYPYKMKDSHYTGEKDGDAYKNEGHDNYDYGSDDMGGDYKNEEKNYEADYSDDYVDDDYSNDYDMKNGDYQDVDYNNAENDYKSDDYSNNYEEKDGDYDQDIGDHYDTGSVMKAKAPKLKAQSQSQKGRVK